MGFCFAGVFLLLARPTWKSMLASLVLVLPGLWLRGYAAGYVKKNAELTTAGPYAHTRNPLYLGSMLIAFGFAAAAWNLAIFLALGLLFAAIYVPTIQGEEAYLRAHFAGFDAYAQAVPRLLPRLLRRRARAGQGEAGGGNAEGFSPALYRRHREYNSAMGAAAIYLALVARLMFHPR
jgi:protein-S-isoprenylcysteine O-methyltransferase Ste14